MAKNTPFSKLTVLDFSRYLPGGYATQVLADLGATVIKVEDTGLGDFMRHDYPTMGGGISYLSLIHIFHESPGMSYNTLARFSLSITIRLRLGRRVDGREAHGAFASVAQR